MQSITHTWKRSLATLALFAAFGAEHGDSALKDAVAAPPQTTTPSAQAEQSIPKENAAPPGSDGSEQSRVATLIRDARLLQETGKLDEAEAKLKEALKIAPQNKKATRALNGIQQAREENATSELTARYGRYGINGVPAAPEPAAGQADPNPDQQAPAAAPGAGRQPTAEAPNVANRYRIDPRLAARYGLLPPKSAAVAAAPGQPAEGAEVTETSDQAAPPPGPQLDPRLAARYGLKVPAAPARPSRGKQQTDAKLNQIVLDEILYDGLPLVEVVRDLNEQARRRDPEKRGINFLISNVPEGPMPTGGIDPTTGQPLPAPPPVFDLNNVLIRIRLRDVRLKDVLDAMTKVSEAPIKYSVEEYGVVFSPGSGPMVNFASASANRPVEPVHLQVRTFKVDTNTFLAGLESAFGIAVPNEEKGKSNPARDIQQALRQLLQQLGVNMDVPNKAVFYNGLTGIIMVRATGEDLELVQAAIETLGGKSLRLGMATPAQASQPATGAPTASVLGKVNREGAVDLPVNGIDILEGIARAGGFSPLANKNKIELSRAGQSRTYRFEDLKQLNPEQRPWLQPGDVLVVHESFF